MADSLDVLWADLQKSMPRGYVSWVQGPRTDGTYSVSVIKNIRPVHQVFSVRGEIHEALREAAQRTKDEIGQAI